VSAHFEVPDDALRPPPPGRPHIGPSRIYRPADAFGVAEVVREAAEAAVWLDSPCAPPRREGEVDAAARECWRVSFQRMTRVLEVDRPRCRVRVQGGLKVGDLVNALAHHGLSLPMVTPPLGASVAGAVSRTAFADHVEALGLVVASGHLVEASREGDAALFEAALQGYGAVGLVVEVTLRVVDAAVWEIRRARLPIEAAAARLTAATASAPSAREHALVWWPHCAWGVVEQTTFRPDPPIAPHRVPEPRSPSLRERLADALVLLSARWPELLRRLQPLAARLSLPPDDTTEAATHVQSVRERPTTWRLDAAVPMDRLTAALEAIAPLLRAPGAHITRPVRVRAGFSSVRAMASVSVCSCSDEVDAGLRGRLIAALIDHGGRPLALQASWSEVQAREAAARAASLLQTSERADPNGLFRGPALLRLFSP